MHSQLHFQEEGTTNDVTGMSPQSSTLAQELNGFTSSGTLYPPLNPTRCEPSTPGTASVNTEEAYYRLRRREPWRMPEGPKRAPGRYDVPVSKGAPRKAMSNLSASEARQGKYGRRPKVEMPEKTESAWRAGVSTSGAWVGRGREEDLLPEFHRRQEWCCTRGAPCAGPEQPGTRKGHQHVRGRKPGRPRRWRGGGRWRSRASRSSV